MVRFEPARRSQDMTPIVRDVDIARYAGAVLKDYRPDLLTEAGALDPYHFADHYLRANILVQDIYTKDKKEKIAGAAFFRDGAVKVFDRDNMTTKLVPVSANTILLDTDTTDSLYAGYEAFTLMHEAGHLLMHQEVYIRGAALCRKNSVSLSRGTLKTSLDFREHQANTFSAFMLMPPWTFIPFVREQIDRSDKLRQLGEDILILKHADDNIMRTIPRNRIIAEASKVYGASRSAVITQLTRYGLAAEPDDDSLYEAGRRLKLYSSLLRQRI